MLKICAKCNKEFKTTKKINNKWVDSRGRIYCWECSTLGRGSRKNLANYDLQNNLKKCIYCKEFLPLHKDYFKLCKGKSYFESACIKCKNVKVKERAIKIKNELVELFGGKCLICNYNKCLRALEFHHLNPKEKEFSLSDGKSIDKMKQELQKCILTCSNCHKEIHTGMHPQYLVSAPSIEIKPS